MFSYSSKSMDNNVPERTISFHQLVELIRNPEDKSKYSKLYELRSNGRDSDCRDFKNNNIHWITPNAVVRNKRLKEFNDFNRNFIMSSGYIYFDIDNIQGDVNCFKKNLIEEFGNVVSLISFSSSKRGVSLLIRIREDISSHEEFVRSYDYLRTKYFSKLNLDNTVKRFGGTWFIPFDIEVYVNHDNFISIPKLILKGSNDVLLSPPHPNIHGVNPSVEKKKRLEYIELTTREVFETSVLQTPVHVDGNYLISPERISQIRFPRVIRDGSKRKVFRKVIHDYLHLNPESTISHVYLFIKTINENHATPKMSEELLRYTVESQYEYIKNQENYQNKSNKVHRLIHYSSKGFLSRKDKVSFSNKLRGILDRYSTFKRIDNAISYLVEEQNRYTNKQIAELLGISISTVKRMLKYRKTDFEKEFHDLEIEIERTIQIRTSMNQS